MHSQKRLNGIGRAFANLHSIQIHAAHAGASGKGNIGHMWQIGQAASTEPVLLGQHDDASPFRASHRQRSKLCRIHQFANVDPYAG